MTHEHFYEELQQKPDLPWEVGPRHESQHGESVRWLPVATIPSARMQLGVSEAGFWVRASNKSVSEFRPGSSHVFLLPVLEVKPDEVQRLLREGLRNKGLSEGYVATFPIEDVILTGLTSQSENWTLLALEWVRQIPLTSRMHEALQKTATEGPTQALRHAAARMLRG